jgi:hypothetical protein
MSQAAIESIESLDRLPPDMSEEEFAEFDAYLYTARRCARAALQLTDGELVDLAQDLADKFDVSDDKAFSLVIPHTSH